MVELNENAEDEHMNMTGPKWVSTCFCIFAHIKTKRHYRLIVFVPSTCSEANLEKGSSKTMDLVISFFQNTTHSKHHWFYRPKLIDSISTFDFLLCAYQLFMGESVAFFYFHRHHHRRKTLPIIFYRCFTCQKVR